MITLKYKDERDRAFGLGGMVVCMGVMESEKYIESVSLDADADNGIAFTCDFFSLSNQQLSAKAVWTDHLNRFQLLTGMAVSNLLSRAVVKDNEEITREVNNLLLKQIAGEGKQQCSLDDDEVRDIYNKTFNYFHRLFYDAQVSQTINRIATTLLERRTLGNEEIAGLLKPMARW